MFDWYRISGRLCIVMMDSIRTIENYTVHVHNVRRWLTTGLTTGCCANHWANRGRDLL